MDDPSEPDKPDVTPDAPGGSGLSGAPFQDTAAYGTGLAFGGAWRDLDHWDRWSELVRFDSPWFDTATALEMFTLQRFAVQVVDGAGPVVDAQVALSRLGEVAFTARTGPDGRVDLFGGVLDGAGGPWALDVVQAPYVAHVLNVSSEGDSRRTITLSDDDIPAPAGVEVAFVVDHRLRADEGLTWAIDALPGIAEQVRLGSPTARIGMVGVDAVDADATPLHTDDTAWRDALDALEPSAGDVLRLGQGLAAAAALDWSEAATGRVAVVMVDTVRLGEPGLERVRSSVLALADAGVRVVGVSLDDDPSTGFLLRHLAILTGGSWVFALEPGPTASTDLVGPYTPEPLEALVAREVLDLAGL